MKVVIFFVFNLFPLEFLAQKRCAKIHLFSKLGNYKLLSIDFS